MLSIFPDLLFLAPVGAFVIRVTVASLFALAAYGHSRLPSRGIHGITPLFAYTLSLFEATTAVSLAVGAWAQVGALLGLLTVPAWMFFGRPARAYPLTTVLLMFVMCASLLVTGPGAFSFDLPL